MNERNDFIKLLQNLPNVLKIWLTLIVTLVGIFIAVRSEKELFKLIFIAIILLLVFIFSFYLALSRFPEKYGIKGDYRFDKIRWIGFLIMGFVAGYIFAFFVVEANRVTVKYALYGTPTAIITFPTENLNTPVIDSTPIATASYSPSPEITSTFTSTPLQKFTPTFAQTSTPMYTSSTEIILKEDFLNNNNNWSLVNSSNRVQQIIGSKFIFKIECSSAVQCEQTNLIPIQGISNFELEFEVKNIYIPIDKTSTIVRFRNYGSGYYFFNIGFSGDILGGIYINKSEEILVQESTNEILDVVDSVNKYRVSVQDTNYTLFVNDIEVAHFEDGNYLEAGLLRFGFIVIGDDLSVEIDNLVVKKIP